MAFHNYDENGNIVRNSTPLDNFEESIVEQHHEPETNINNIIAKHGLVTSQDIDALKNMRFDDVTNNDFQEMMNMMIRANESFSNIPSNVRAHFNNDAAAFLDFTLNPDNHQQLIDWGLAEQGSPAPKPMRVVMVDENDQVIRPATETPPVITT
jgi:hypothetical protein